MIRNCDGADPYVQREDGQPCDCGATFDDINHRVVHPHEKFAKLTPEDLNMLMRNYGA